MSKIVESLASLEQQIQDIRSKVDPLVTKIDGITRTVAAVTEQVDGLGKETLEIQEGILAAQSGFESIQTLLRETRSEGEELIVIQDENQRLCDSLTAMFGEAFQTVSRFLETARKMGLVDKEKAAALLSAKIEEISKPVVEPKAVEATLPEPVTEEAPETIAEPETAEVAPPEPVVEAEAEWPEPVAEEAPETIAEPATAEVALPEPVVEEVPEDFFNESTISEDDFPLPSSETTDLPELAFPGLPDVTTPSDILPPVDDIEIEAETKTSEEIASQLDLPPLQLETPQLPETDSKTNELTDDEEQRIEDLLTDLSKPMST